MICSVVNGISVQAEESSDRRITILFSHDMHDHFLPQKELVQNVVREKGGYGKLKTIIDKEREANPELLLVDAGDFSMGTLFQTVFASHAPQLQMMGLLGYDAVTLGNHEFDFRAQGLTEMLRAARDSGKSVPTLVASNIVYENPDTNQDLKSLQLAMDEYGAKDYTLLEKNGIKIGIFGLMGEDAESNAPMAGVAFKEPIEQAKQIVKELKDQGADLILCLSHSGTSSDPKKSEDVLLAQEVPDIDVIISGHTHSTLEEPIIVGNTIIGSCGEYGSALGKIQLKQDSIGNWGLEIYDLLEVTEEVASDISVDRQIQQYEALVNKEYLSSFGYTFDQVLSEIPFHFEEAGIIGKIHGELRLGNFIADAYRYAIQKAEGEHYKPIAMAAVPSGTIRGSFVAGPITVADVFTVSSLGIGADAAAGYPLLDAYLTGKELKTVTEVDASITPIMPEAQLYLSGVNFTFNPNRLIFNKVTDIVLIDERGQEQAIQDDELYRVVVGLYSAQMLSVVGEKSFGILSIVPKDECGVPITDFESRILHNQVTGKELKEWEAIATYLQSFNTGSKEADDLMAYSNIEGRKVVENNNELIAKIEKPNTIAWVIYGVLVLICSILICSIWIIYKQILKKRRNK